MPAAGHRILRGKSLAIGGLVHGRRNEEAVHRSSTPRLLSVLQRPYWSPPPRSLLPTLELPVDFPSPDAIFHGIDRESRSPECALARSFSLFFSRAAEIFAAPSASPLVFLSSSSAFSLARNIRRSFPLLSPVPPVISEYVRKFHVRFRRCSGF